jgi:probable rRNA maturation factor
MSAQPDIAVTVLDAAWLAAVPDAAERAARAAAAALAAHGAGAEGELSVALGDDALLRRLNRDHRGQDKATNVLAFPLAEPDADPALPALLGDVVVARETVLREAAAQGKKAADHLVHLVVHGTLHVLGHDHSTDADAARMEALETAVLAGLGIADPYAARPDDAARGAA